MSQPELTPGQIESVRQRLLARKIVTPDGCWEYAGSRIKRGYGLMQVDTTRKLTTHRAAAAIWLGFDLTSSLWVLHSCDNPPCFNPAHLFFGDAAMNAADRDSKGRTARGVTNAATKLTPEMIAEIRSSDATQRELARRLGISKSLVGNVRRGELYAAVEEAA